MTCRLIDRVFIDTQTFSYSRSSTLTSSWTRNLGGKITQYLSTTTSTPTSPLDQTTKKPEWGIGSLLVCFASLLEFNQFHQSKLWRKTPSLTRHLRTFYKLSLGDWGKTYRSVSSSRLWGFRPGDVEKHNNGDTPVVKHSSFSRFIFEIHAHLLISLSSIIGLYYEKISFFQNIL